MGMYCELRQVSPAYAQQLVQEPDRIFEYLEDPALEGEQAAGEELSLDKAWHGMHYILTGAAQGGLPPWCYLLEGGVVIGDESHEFDFGPVRLLPAPQLAAFSQALALVTPAVVKAGFKPVEMEKLDIYPGIWSRSDEGLEEWLNEMFGELRGFIKRALDKQQEVLLYIG